MAKDLAGEMAAGHPVLSTDAAVLDGVPLERLEEEISGFASRIAAATAQWLVWWRPMTDVRAGRRGV